MRPLISGLKSMLQTPTVLYIRIFDVLIAGVEVLEFILLDSFLESFLVSVSDLTGPDRSMTLTRIIILNINLLLLSHQYY